MLPIESPNHPLTEALGWTLIHFLWQGTLVGIVAAIALAAMRNRTASARYLASIMSLAVMAICPLVTAGVLVSQIPAAAPAVVDVEPAPAIETAEPATETTLLETTTAVAAALPEEPAPSKPVPRQPAPELSLAEQIDQLAPWVTVAWFVGAALLSLRLLFSWFQVIRITRFGLKPVDDAIQRTFDSLCERMGLRRIVRVFESTLIAVPATVGWLRPIVLLPATAITGLSEEQLIAVLAHELAHVRRYDYVVNLAQGVVETLLFYHPAVWLLSKRIRTERENCCDDAAVEITGEPVEYVRALTQLAQPAPAPKLATAATGGELATRARRLLGQPAQAEPKAAGAFSLLSLVILSLGLCLDNKSLARQDTATINDQPEQSSLTNTYGTGQQETQDKQEKARNALVKQYYEAFVKRQTHIKQSRRPLDAMLKALDEDQTAFANFKAEWEKIGGPVPAGPTLKPIERPGREIDKVLLQKSLKRLRTELKQAKQDREHFSRMRDEMSELLRLAESGVTTRPTNQRWFIRFANRESQQLYERQLDHFKIELAAYFPTKNELVYLANASEKKPSIRRTPVQKFDLRKVLSKNTKQKSHRHEADTRIFAKADIDVSEASVLHVYPKGVEKQLREAEAAFQSRKPGEIARTYFKVEPRDDDFKFVVTRQIAQDAKEEVKLKLSNTPTWIIAKHVIIFEGKHVVEWDHVVDSLATLATREGKVKASFQFTPGARDKFQPVQQDIFKAMKGLPRRIPMSIGSGGIASHDDVQTQADLDPDPRLRIVARALQPDGKPASEADVAVVPPLGKKFEHYIYLSGTRLRNKLDHDYRQAKESGGFVVHPKDGSTVFVTHKSGYALIPSNELRKQRTIRLTPWATVKGKVFESPGHEQRLTFSTRPRKHFLFMFYDIVIDAEGNYEVKVPAGEVAASRSVKADQATSFGRGVAIWTLKPGQTKSFDLKPMTEYEIEGFELQKKQSAARRGGPPLTAEDEKRLLERLKIDLEKRKQQAKRKGKPPANKE